MMEFEEVYQKYNKIIHYLLKRYQINYNYDEFYQRLLIKLWQLNIEFDEQKSISMSTYLFTRLKYCLIDNFRKESNKITLMTIDETLNTSTEPTRVLNDFNLTLEDITYELMPHESRWLILHLQGYKQYEIAQLMGVSLTTIKKIKLSTKQKCLSHFKNL